MPSINCKCGHRISYGEIPTINQWLMISDLTYDEYSGNIDAERLYSQMTPALECPICHRFMIFWSGFNNSPIIYERA